MPSLKPRAETLWRSLEEAGSDRSLSPGRPADAIGSAPLDRRQFLGACGASLAISSLAACSRPPQGEIVPYARSPAGQVDGVPRFFATTLLRDGYGLGVLVESNMGRPTKIEGNPRHPASLGSTDIFAQAAVLQLWDPDRSQTVVHGGEIATWESFAAAMLPLRSRFARSGGAGLHLLTGNLTSPTLGHQLGLLQQRYPEARWYVHQAAGNDGALAGAKLAFGETLSTRLHLERATVLLSLDADFLCDPAAGVRYARDFALRRAAQGPERRKLRHYAVEATPTLTGAMADHRLALDAASVQRFACQIASRLGISAKRNGGVADAQHAAWLAAVTRDLQANRGAALVVIGNSQPAWMHALGHAMNNALGGFGSTLSCSEPVELLAAQNGTLSDLTTAMQAGVVDTLIVLDSNPVYDAPVDLNFAAELRRVPHLLHIGLYRDETGMRSEWHLPLAHALEAWSDARAFDGTASIAQPLIAPLYGGRSVHELLSALFDDTAKSGYQLVRDFWRGRLPHQDEWSAVLQSGLIPDTAAAAKTLPLQTAFLAQVVPAEASGLELLFRSDPTVGDGRWSNNAWLQELPKPLTQLTWDNPALISPQLAGQQSLANGDVIELRVRGHALRLPVWIMPGQAPHSVTLHLGYGRRHAGHIGDGRGFNAFELRTAAEPWRSAELSIAKTGEHYALAGTQHHFRMESRDPVRIVGAADEAHGVRLEAGAHLATLYPEYPAGEYAWGMSIDLDACIGCKACTIACQAENNIPVVGKEEVSRGREMHWIRVDRYYSGTPEDPLIYSQPVPCMMCEHAPCELVCPVDATVHDAEGLNVQVYNRCVGTRFCSNNCPYKVRRFNFLQYVDAGIETLKAQRNPDVTVRRRGVMEKCTYCIQRIEEAHIVADRESRRIRDGEVLTACQAVCPTQAIRFGDLADPDSPVAHAKRSVRNYLLLSELNTRPRTSYLARIRNPNPDLEGT
jgi:Fe-S-cluster-containing dehydrogenase component